MSWSSSELRVRLAPWNRFKPCSKIFYWLFQGGTSFCGSFMFYQSCACYAFVLVCLYVPWGHLLGKGWLFGSRLWRLSVKLSLSQWLSFVRCETWLYQFLIFAPLLTLDTLWNVMRVDTFWYDLLNLDAIWLRLVKFWWHDLVSRLDTTTYVQTGMSQSSPRLGANLIRSSRSGYSIWDDVARAYTRVVPVNTGLLL